MAAERIQLFLEDQPRAVASQSRAKVASEIGRLRAWLVKHQDETVPDGAKAKLVTIMEKYNRSQAVFADIRDAVAALFNDFLQMPEGKLVSARDKNKVLGWLQGMASDDDNEASAPAAPKGAVLSQWTVEGADTTKRTVSLLNTVDPDLWREDVKVPAALLQQIVSLLDQGAAALVQLDEGSGEIVSVEQTDL